MINRRFLFRSFFSVILAFEIAGQMIIGSCTENTAVLTLRAMADAMVKQNFPGQNFGSGTLIGVEAGPEGRASLLVAFDLSEIPPGASIIYARLSLYLCEPPRSSRTYQCYAILSGWDERTVTWNDKPGISPIYAKPASIGNSAGWISWDVTAQLQKFVNGIREDAWMNYGWEISDEEGSDIQSVSLFYSREALDEELRPKLEVSFAPPRLNISMPPTMMAGSWIRLEISRLSKEGVPSIADRITKKYWIEIGTLTVKLATTSPSGFFSLTKGGTPVETVTIPDGKTRTEVYYFDNNPGENVIRISAEDYPDSYYDRDSKTIRVLRDDIPPSIADVKITPESPLAGDTVMVSAYVSDNESGLEKVFLLYSMDGGADWIRVQMVLVGDQYRAFIPSQNVFAEILYYVEASDVSGNTAKSSTGRISFGIPLWVYAGAIIALLVGAAVVIRTRRARR
jgi:hypothetical protein